MKKVALVGCGRISRRHIEAIKANKDIEITLVCDVLEEKAKQIADELNVPYVTDYKKIKNVDVISVLTPSGMHPMHVAEIAETTDAPYIVCEKPLSLTLREAYEVYTRVDKAGKRILPVYQNRYNPLVQLVKEMIADGRLGQVYQFVCNALWNRNDAYYDISWHGTKELDGGVLYTQASHYVDMLHFFFGKLENSKGIGGSKRKFEVYDSVSAVMEFENNVIGALNTTVNAYEKNYETEFTLMAEKGLIRISGTNLNEIKYWNVEGMEKPDLDFKLDHVYGKGHDTLYRYIVEEKWEKFPSREDVLSGIHMMERLSY